MTTVAHSYLNSDEPTEDRTPTTTCDVVPANSPCGHPLCDRCELGRLATAMHAAGSAALAAEDANLALAAKGLENRALIAAEATACAAYVAARAAYVAALDAA